MQIHDKLPWAEIQREWETTTISATALAKKYAIPSKTTMLRRRDTEGWVREVDAGEACPARGAVIADPAATTVKAQASEDGVATTGHERASADGEIDVSPEGFLEAGRRGLADFHDTLAARHVALARVVQETGVMAMRRLQGVLKAPVIDSEGLHDMGDRAREGGDEADVLGNLQRLIRVNPDRDTLSGLLTAAGKAIELGVNMERRAMADMAARPQPKQGEGKQRMSMRQMIETMPPETAAHLRAWAVKVQQDRREAEIAGNAEPPVNGSD